MLKKVITKKEQIDCIVKTLDLNFETIDYIENHILQLDNVYKLSPGDEIINKEIYLNKYILTNLKYLEQCYFDKLKKLGYKYKKKEG